MSNEGDRIAIDELCALVDLPRRTVRYYIQEGLVDRPAGAKRGAYYTRRHLEQLMTIRTWQRAGLSLERIRELVSEGAESASPLPWPLAFLCILFVTLVFYIITGVYCSRCRTTAIGSR